MPASEQPLSLTTSERAHYKGLPVLASRPGWLSNRWQARSWQLASADAQVDPDGASCPGGAALARRSASRSRYWASRASLFRLCLAGWLACSALVQPPEPKGYQRAPLAAERKTCFWLPLAAARWKTISNSGRLRAQLAAKQQPAPTTAANYLCRLVAI